MGEGKAILEGRGGAMQALRDALAQAAADRGCLAVISGDAGIGKSTLAAALAGEAEAAGADVQWGRAWEFADAPPYFPVRGALRALGIDPHDTAFRDDGGSFRLWEEVVEALARRPSPVVWLLEDLHAADLRTLDLLTFLAQAVRALRVLVVGTARDKDPRLDERASQRLSRMARDGIDLRLSPLAAGEVRSVAESVCGGPLPRSVVERLVEITGGNPLFVVECARTFQASGTIAALPPTVRHVVLDRFEQLPAATRAALAHGAVLGREVTAALVGRMQGALPARVIDDLSPALRAGLVNELEPGRFVFSHVIVRDVVEDSLSAEERARLHALAEAALAASADSVENAVERARHALAAASAGEGGRAVELARHAILLLERDGAHDRAFAVCERLVAASAASEVASALTIDDWMQHARIAIAAGRYAESRRLCDRVLASARDARDARTFAEAALLVGADIRPALVDRTLVSLLEEAQAMLGDADAALACRVEARLAAALQPHDDFEVPMAMARKAIARARTLGDDVLLEVLETGVSALVDFAPLAERLAAYAELLERADAAGDRVRVLRAHMRLAMDHVFSGDFSAFARDVDALMQVASELGHPRFRWRALLLSSMRAMAAGDFADSERAIIEVTELASVTDDPSSSLTLEAHRVHRSLHLGRDDELRSILPDLPRMFRPLPIAAPLVAGYRAMLLARIEDERATREALDDLGDARRFFEREISGATQLAEAVALAGTDAHRRELRAFLDPHAGCEATAGHVVIAYDGPVARALALLEASLGDVRSAERRLGEAIERAKERGHRTWVAQLAYDLARVLTRAGRAADARPHAEASFALAGELGMQGVALRAQKLLAGAAPSPPAVVTKPAFALEREGDVWRVTHGERIVRVRDSRGMQLLARLVERPDEEVHVLALASDAGGAGLAETNAGDVLDERARRAYRERSKDLAAAIDEAEANGDRGRVEKLQHERAMLADELARAVGLGGRMRKEGSATERARVNVQRRVKDAIARVAEVDPQVGRFLERAVRTGTFCCFRP